MAQAPGWAAALWAALFAGLMRGGLVALRAAADAGATSAHVRMDSPVVFGHLSLGHRVRAEHLIQLKEEVEAQKARYPGRVKFARIPTERNGVADELAKEGARASKALSADRRR